MSTKGTLPEVAAAIKAGACPADPVALGMVGRGRRMSGEIADPNGNRAERRTHARHIRSMGKKVKRGAR